MVEFRTFLKHPMKIFAGVLITLLFLFWVFLSGPATPTKNYGIIFDAGSSHTAASLFTWNSELRNFTTLSWKKELTPGISSFASNLDGIGPYFKELIAFASEAIPKSEHSRTPIFIKATAGLRLLPPAKRDTILKAVREYLSQPANNPFLFKADNAQMISGQEEAVFGWITTNWLLGTLTDDVATASRHGVAPGRTAAMLDLGGGSNQIAFEMDPTAMPSEIDHDDLPTARHCFQPPATPLLRPLGQVPVEVFGRRRAVFAVSFLGYGRDRAFLRLGHALTHLAPALATRDPPPAPEEHPLQSRALGVAQCPAARQACLWNAEDHPMTDFQQARMGPVEKSGTEWIPHGCLAGAAHFEAREGGSTWQLVGEGVPTGCQTLLAVTDLLNLTTPCMTASPAPSAASHCSVSGHLLPTFIPAGMPVFGCSAYHYTRKALGLPAHTTAAEIKRAAEGFCGMNDAALAQRYPTDKYRDGHCFSGTYIWALLTRAFGVPADYPLTLDEKIDSIETGWTLGAMIYEAHQMAGPTDPYARQIMWLSLGLVAIAAVAVAGGLLVLRRRAPGGSALEGPAPGL
ncbi:putative ectonucleoside triphosphate diphosphohydrolase 1 [Paratrimastix pyriformis]|uniref:Ectonucleoside triphosphate diphosphohydrolase 1 n=1 Tax=Paratrimastix pyriformis TaxID=342808 RepID=A0ABQ8UH14_9EUKA|nr:putative ectonucleoside triphosphate diphosphohydrolase 1 [Paratrimastix pyriformis]